MPERLTGEGIVLVLTEFQEKLFESLRSSTEPFDAALSRVFSENQEHPTIFSDMLYLLGNIRASNAQAEGYFKRVDQHRRHLEAMLGYQVDIRVALMDYFINIQPKYRYPKIVELADFEESLQRAAGDSLTGLFNRASFNEICHAEVCRSERHNYNLSLAFIDIDHFKNINDTWGHQTGDSVLISMGKYLRSCLRSEDYAFRYGGEEFLLLLPQTALDGLEHTMLRLYAETSRLNSEDFSVTFSTGTAVFPQDGTTLDELVATADRRMYRAKVDGRNRVCYEG